MTKKKVIPEDEINKTIAEFMGLDDLKVPGEPSYTESLDALIPVVEKLDYWGLLELSWDGNYKEWDVFYDTPSTRNLPSFEYHPESIYDKSPSRALAQACYGIIKDLKNE